MYNKKSEIFSKFLNQGGEINDKNSRNENGYLRRSKKNFDKEEYIQMLEEKIQKRMEGGKNI